MKSMPHPLLVCILSLSALAAQQPADAPSTRPTGAWWSEREIHVPHAGDGEALVQTLQKLNSAAVIEPIVTRYGLGADGARFVTIDMKDSDDRTRLQITVDLSQADLGTPLAAREVADALVASLREMVQSGVPRRAHPAVAKLEQATAEAEAQLKQARDRLNALRQKLREQTGRSEASAERIRDELAQLENHREELELEMEAKAARVTALSENIARTARQIEAKVQNDEVAAELQKVVDSKQRQVEMLSEDNKAGHQNRAELDEAVAQLAEARARLIERRAEALSAAGGETVNEWNKELMGLSVDSAELQVRLQKMSERLARFQQVSGELEELEGALEAREHAAEVVRELRVQLRAVRIDLSPQSPAAALVRSEDRTSYRPKRGED